MKFNIYVYGRNCTVTQLTDCLTQSNAAPVQPSASILTKLNLDLFDCDRDENYGKPV